MVDVYLSLGSNLGDREAKLKEASGQLQKLLGPLSGQSGVYETAAWGQSAQSAFLNQVLKFPLEEGRENWLLNCIHELESALGRIRQEKWGPRVIDIDILLAGSQVIHTAALTVPHPFLHLRRFVLVPLNELAPDMLHPVLHKTISELLDACSDPLNVQKFR